MKKILVTGANGQLGNEIKELASQYKHIFCFTDVEELDITSLKNIKNVIKHKNIDIVVNCAAYTNVDNAEDDEKTAELINAHAVENLAVACRDADITLFHVSTDYVFQGNKSIPFLEDQTTNPIGAYGRTKLAGEQAIINVGCKYLIFRTAWLYSSFGNNFVKTMIKLTKEKENLKVVFDQVGTPTYAKDLADIIMTVIDSNLFEANNGIYHFSNEGVCSWYDFAKEINQLCGHNCEIEPCHSEEFPSKVKRPNFSVLDKTKVKSTFNVGIPYWKDSLIECYNILSKNKK